MKRLNFSHEHLKLVACITMLIDHIGFAFSENIIFRIIGRLSFPIFCFLLAEGVFHTKDPKKYGLRLALAAFISEIPFDLFSYGSINLTRQSVMVTLLFGFFAIQAMKSSVNKWSWILPVVILALLAHISGANYGAFGVLLIALFWLTRELPYKRILQAVGMVTLFSEMSSQVIQFGSFSLPIQVLGVFSLLPISLYNGIKLSKSPFIQWSFYLFYPIHLLLLFHVTLFT